jgi:hypothetical protein
MTVQVQEPKDVNVSRLDNANADNPRYPTRGEADFRAAPSGNPSNREAPHSAPLGTPGRGMAGVPAHTLANPTSINPTSMKSSRLDIMKEMLFPDGR